MFILLVQEHGISFHFFEFSLISFFNVLLLSVHNPFTSLVRFIPRLFSYLGGVVLKAHFLTFFFWYFIVSVKKCKWFLYVLILYPATMLNSFISSSNFCVDSLGFSIVLCHPHIMTVLPLPFQFGYISFPFLVWWLGFSCG